MSEDEQLATEHAIFEQAVFGREVVDYAELMTIYGAGVKP